MCYLKFSWTIFVFLVLITLVTGSCLEFGHSCWGAHGKRSGSRASIAVKQQAPLVDTLAEQLFDNNNNNNEDSSSSSSSQSNSINKSYSLAPAGAQANGEAASSAERIRAVNGGKWARLLRQQRYQLRQMQRQFDASDAADSWRKLQQALAEAEQQQQQQQQQQRQQQPVGDFFELTK